MPLQRTIHIMFPQHLPNALQALQKGPVQLAFNNNNKISCNFSLNWKQPHLCPWPECHTSACTAKLGLESLLTLPLPEPPWTGACQCHSDHQQSLGMAQTGTHREKEQWVKKQR